MDQIQVINDHPSKGQSHTNLWCDGGVPNKVDAVRTWTLTKITLKETALLYVPRSFSINNFKSQQSQVHYQTDHRFID